MKTILLAAAATMMFATGAGADHVYHGLADGNTDLFDRHRSVEPMVGVQRGVGDSFDPYWGIAEGNADLFKRIQGSATASKDPQIYHELRGNPDLTY